MLDCQRQTFLRKVEHVEDDGLRATVLAVVDGVHHLDHGLALVNGLLLAVLSDDGQLALYQYAVVHHGMVVPAQLLAGGEDVLDGYQLGPSLQVVGQLDAVPTLRRANQFGVLNLGGCSLAGAGRRAGLTRGHHNGAADGKGGGEHPLHNLSHFLFLFVLLG